MKHLLLAMAVAAGLCAAQARADAVDVVVSDGDAQTSDGQNFHFDFGPGLPKGPIAKAELTLHARGDYTPSNEFEYLSWDLDGLLSDPHFKPLGDDILAINSGNDVEWTHTFTLDKALFEAAVADGALSLFIDLSGNVDIGVGQPFMNATISYRVPEPASLALLGLGAFGIVWRRRRRA